jgi:short-subunit dehydrogenase
MRRTETAPEATPAASTTAAAGGARFGALNPPLTGWHGRRVWLVGASSGIGRATASALHAAGARVTVSARSESALQAFAAAHPGAVTVAVDATDRAAIAGAAASLLADGPLDVVVYCAGYYREHRATAFDLDDMLRHQQVNYVGALHLLAAVVPHFVARGAGHVSLVSSVAGFRGLPKSLAYGPTKAALINLAQTLYMDLQPRGIGVSLINPGFVETPLTAQNEFHMPAMIQPEQAARAILAGWARGRFEIHFPRRFTWAMKALGLLPFGIYQRVVRRLTGL